MPWVMGLSNRMIQSIDKTKSEKIQNDIGYNFRVWHNLRKLFLNDIKLNQSKYPLKKKLTSEIDEKKFPEDFFYYLKTNRRHNIEYYKIINSSLLFLGIGGYVETLPKLYQPYNLIDKIRRKPNYLINKFTRNKKQFVFQWDSFRMWELFYANTCPIFLNFKKFNFLLPNFPIENEHYLSIDEYSWKSFDKKLSAMSNAEIKQIGTNGKKWVIKNYSPKMISKYLLSLI